MAELNKPTDQTVLQLVDNIYAGAVDLGMDVSVKDTAFIITTFLEGLAAHPSHPEANAALLAIAAEVAKAKDE